MPLNTAVWRIAAGQGSGIEVNRPAGGRLGAGQRRLADLPGVEQQNVDGVQPGQLPADIPQRGTRGHLARDVAEQQLAQFGEVIACTERADRGAQFQQILAGDGVQVVATPAQYQPCPQRQVLAGAVAG